ncbi:sensor histidine kinase [Vacuolonema iberomarrocanum]|uniref:sensor histidine kinase n=1 Tax=Vacuolonema iberomarrocanum TaxID=3454632 RepID=UPI001A0FDEEC|nr:GAF domain-containing sensor histidine kinase [filamentous cyanobacterium LEGE 07170]
MLIAFFEVASSWFRCTSSNTRSRYSSAMNPNLLEKIRHCCHDPETFERVKTVLESEDHSFENRQQTLFNIVSRIRESLELQNIFETTAHEVQQLLDADRVGMFRFYPESDYNDGEFVSECVKPGFDSILAVKVHDHCFGQDYACHYAAGRAQAIADIHKAGLQDCHVDVLARFQIRANLVVPLLLGRNLWGLLCIHQCAEPRDWQPDEIEFVEKIATELGIALSQAELFDQTRQQSIDLHAALTQLQQAQAHLIQSEKMSSLGQLVAGIAHEINNPVNFIHGNLTHATQYADELMHLLHLYHARLATPDSEIQEYEAAIDLEFLLGDFPKMLSSMHLGAERIRQLVLSLRNFSRLDEAEMKPVDIHEGLESTLLILQYRLKPKTPGEESIQILKDYSELPMIECYASQLNQVFMNILSNAIDSLQEQSEESPQEGKIFITTSLEPSPTLAVPCAAIVIRDNGPGIPEEVMPRLFDPFFTTKPAGKGTGLGLSISYQIVVERHGGSLQCTSSPGQGTEFRIEIPVKSMAQDAWVQAEQETNAQDSMAVN